MKRVILIVCLLAFISNFALAETKRGTYIKNKKDVMFIVMPFSVWLIYKIIKQEK